MTQDDLIKKMIEAGYFGLAHRPGGFTHWDKGAAWDCLRAALEFAESEGWKLMPREISNEVAGEGMVAYAESLDASLKPSEEAARTDAFARGLVVGQRMQHSRELKAAWTAMHDFSPSVGAKEPAKCSACGGSGRYDNDGSPPCGACNGTGRE